MSQELRQVANGFDNKVKAYSGYDVNGYRFHIASYEHARPIEKPQTMEFFLSQLLHITC